MSLTGSRERDANAELLGFVPYRVPVTILFVVALLIPTSPEIGGIGLRLEDLLLAGLGSVFLLDVLVQGRIEILGKRFFGALVLVWLTGVVATVIGALLGTASLTSLNPAESGTLTILKETELVVLFLMVCRYVRSRSVAARMLGTLCLGGTLLASLVILELLAFERGGIVPPKQYHLMGEIFGFTASLSAGRLLFGSPPKQSRVFFGSCLILGTVGVLVSGEAGAFIGAAVAVGLLAFAAWHRPSVIASRRMLLVGVVTTTVVTAIVLISIPSARKVVSEQFLDLLSVLWGEPRNSVQARFSNWRQRVPEVLIQRPLIGFGQMAIRPGGLDNEYFQRLYYTGLLGFGAYLYMLSVAIRTALGTVQRDATGLVGGYAGVVGVMIGAGLAKGVFHSTKSSAFFVMCSALVFVLVHRDGFNRDESIRS